MSERLPQGRLLAFYGDDFTGSTAVMEAMSFAGLPTVLFLGVPGAEDLQSYGDYAGIGIAGVARSKSPAWMDQHLPPVFDALAQLGAPINHYKVCSTLDSAPHIGSIGKAAELAIPRVGGSWHPILIAAPIIKRYQAFGNLFAIAGGKAYRLDRHPTMSRHPVTPMHEADVTLHIGKQTDLPIGLVDLIALKSGNAAATQDHLVAIDCVDEETLKAAGRLIWQNRGDRLFVIGSQGVEYALIAHWQAEGMVPPAPPLPALKPARRIAVVSGSCSPVTAEQIDMALGNGFADLRLDVTKAVDTGAWQRELANMTTRMRTALSEGTDPLVYTARGPDDDQVIALNSAIEVSGVNGDEVHERIGSGLGHLLGQILDGVEMKRAVIAGGDSSGHASLALGIRALTAKAPVAASSMLCAAKRADDELELALKGGQMGGPDYFVVARDGHDTNLHRR